MGIKGGFKREVPTGLWIRDRLLEEEAHIHDLYRRHKLELLKKGYKPGTYQNFLNYFNVLKKLGLIEEVGRAPAVKILKNGSEKEYSHLHERIYYRITKGKENDPAWQNPWKYNNIVVTTLK